MSTVADAKRVFAELPAAEAWQFKAWLDEQMEDDWDRQIETDATAGKLDQFAGRALAHYQAGRIKPLDEVLDHT